MSIVKSYSFPDGEIRGDMYYIKHGTNNYTVIDCYLKDGNDKNARKEEIGAVENFRGHQESDVSQRWCTHDTGRTECLRLHAVEP